MSDLKPCPMCGGEAEVRLIGNDHTKKRRTDIVCSRRGCTLGIRVGAIYQTHEWTKDKAIETWNARPEEDRLKTQNAELLEALVSASKELREMFNGGDWYCPECHTFVPPEEVTYDELHENCETYLVPHQERNPLWVMDKAISAARESHE